MAEELKIVEEVKNLKSHVEGLLEKSNGELEKKLNGKVESTTKEEIKKALDKYDEAYKKLTKEQQDHIDTLDATIQKMGKGREASKSVNDLMIENWESEVIQKAWKEERRGSFYLPELTGKAVGTMTESASLTGEVIEPTRDNRIHELAQRKTHIRSLFPQGTMTGNVFRFIKESAGEGGADVSAEAAAKNQVDYDLGTTDALVCKITAYVRVSEELIDDVPALQGFLGRRLNKDIRTKEDQQLLYGTGLSNQLTGITDGAASFSAWEADSNAQALDLYVQVIAQLEAANYEATGIVLNPKDFYSLYLLKGTDAHYLTNGKLVFQGTQMFICGVPVSRSNAVTQGEYIVGDFQMGAQIFDRKGLNIRFYDQDQDNAIKNLITVVAEERLAFPIFYADAFIYGTIATDVAAIQNYS